MSGKRSQEDLIFLAGFKAAWAGAAYTEARREYINQLAEEALRAFQARARAARTP